MNYSRDQSENEIEKLHGRLVYRVLLPQTFKGHKCSDCGDDAKYIIIETPKIVEQCKPWQPIAWPYCGDCSIGG